MAQIEYRTGGGVVIDGDRMLLLARPSRGEIRLPKGHIDPGETPTEAALREVSEETGYGDLEITDDLGVHLVEFDYNGNHYRRQEYYFVMRLRSQQRIARTPQDEAQFQVLWAPLNEAPTRLTFAAEQAVAHAAIVAVQEDGEDVHARRMDAK
jgi:8-oxo-dGTP pyrophosphatase MutT (NUDIX family)